MAEWVSSSLAPISKETLVIVPVVVLESVVPKSKSRVRLSVSADNEGGLLEIYVKFEVPEVVISP